ncbi:cyclic AMP-dependent transcription factor ATF-3-like [Anneissia japonica]|uniref:cyclic AMP-dependent transcription factor ATF-3-like n=1 Tax=Anneissia japonica TaxID=1529436 RepID=UPI0014259021|nr:cyclic AMP-dependent transcription factor ATF-3-like [Anneissia japonica]
MLRSKQSQISPKCTTEESQKNDDIVHENNRTPGTTNKKLASIKVANVESTSKRQMKRTRNRELAQKSRNRRREKVMSLVLESEKLDARQKELTAEVSLLQQEANQLVYILECHRCHYGNACPIVHSNIHFGVQ